MSITTSIQGFAQLSMLLLYLCAVPAAIVYLFYHRRDCLNCTFWQAWLRSSVLAFLVTPSFIGDFWLFAVPGPAALGFALFSPAVIFDNGQRPELLLMMLVLYLLPWLACTTLIFYVWRIIRWRKHGR